MSDKEQPNNTDIVVPFLFDNLPVRGALVQLQDAWSGMRQTRTYEGTVEQILGQAAAATALIAQSLKFEGKITFQISGSALEMLVMQCTSALEMRGMAGIGAADANKPYAALVRGGHCAITVDQGNLERPYQGIVEMVGDSLSHSLQNYFSRSAQIESHVILVADQAVCGGILLQQMPDARMPQSDDWGRLGLLAATLRTVDVADGIGAGLIGRLFAEDDVRIFDSRAVNFKCRCSPERAAEILKLLGEVEAQASLDDSGSVVVTCEYCGQRESFDSVDIRRLFAEHVVDNSDAIH